MTFFWYFADPFSIPNPEKNHIELWYGTWGYLWVSGMIQYQRAHSHTIPDLHLPFVPYQPEHQE